MTPETLSSLAAILLSLVFSYVPGLAPKYEALDPTLKRLIMLAALLVISLGAYGLACAGWSTDLNVICTQTGAYGLAKTFLAALIANQSTYLISPKPAPLPSREGAG